MSDKPERWVVMVTRLGRKVSYVTLASYASCQKNARIAIERGYKDAQVVSEAEFRRIIGASPGS